MPVSGYMHVEGTDFHYIDSSGAERAITGALEGTTGKTAGYIWIEGTSFHYIDSSGAERTFDSSAYVEDGFTYTFDAWFST
jgi:hypothetical protein